MPEKSHVAKFIGFLLYKWNTELFKTVTLTHIEPCHRNPGGDIKDQTVSVAKISYLFPILLW